MIVGMVTKRVEELLSLAHTEDNRIYCADTNIAHMETHHPRDYVLYGTHIEEILAAPDYVGCNPSDGSIEYVKEFIVNNEYVKVAVRLTGNGKYYARSLYVLNPRRVNNFVAKGTLKKV